MRIASKQASAMEENQNSELAYRQAIAQKEALRLWKLPGGKFEVNKTCIVVAGDLTAGVLLNRIINCYMTQKHNGKQPILLQNKEWIAKTRMEWGEDCRISPRQFDRAITILENLKVVETAVFRYEGNPTKHITINWKKYLELFQTSLNSAK